MFFLNHPSVLGLIPFFLEAFCLSLLHENKTSQISRRAYQLLTGGMNDFKLNN